MMKMHDTEQVITKMAAEIGELRMRVQEMFDILITWKPVIDNLARTFNAMHLDEEDRE